MSVDDPRADAFASLGLWWAMVQADAVLRKEPIADDSIVLHFMGSGASTSVTAKQMRELFATVELPFPGRIRCFECGADLVTLCIECNPLAKRGRDA